MQFYHGNVIQGADAKHGQVEDGGQLDEGMILETAIGRRCLKQSIVSERALQTIRMSKN
jgi:hypothetical protein